MASRIRILLVDDSSTIRLILSQILARDPQLEIAGTAVNGREALDKLDELRPDFVLLDVEMPVMDGLTALAALRQSHPRLPVIMFSRLTQRGVEATIDALLLGANDYVPKPEAVDEVERTIEQELIPKIKALATPRRESPSAETSRSGLVPQRKSAVPEVVVIAASTGGPMALAPLLSSLPKRITTPVLVVQHMPPNFTATFAERLCTKTELNVREAEEDQAIASAQVWIARGGCHMVVAQATNEIRVQLNHAPAENSCCPSADVLFRSATEIYGSRILAVVLTGMGKDGLAGCRAIKEQGGTILVQDEASSVVWGMAGHVARAGLAEDVLPLDQLGPEITSRLSSRSS